MSHGELIYVSNDDHGKLVALFDDRRKMVKRHSLAKKKPSRAQHTLAEKIAIDRQHKAELDALNSQIVALMKATEGAA